MGSKLAVNDGDVRFGDLAVGGFGVPQGWWQGTHFVNGKLHNNLIYSFYLNSIVKSHPNPKVPRNDEDMVFQLLLGARDVRKHTLSPTCIEYNIAHVCCVTEIEKTDV